MMLVTFCHPKEILRPIQFFNNLFEGCDLYRLATRKNKMATSTSEDRITTVFVFKLFAQANKIYFEEKKYTVI